MQWINKSNAAAGAALLALSCVCAGAFAAPITIDFESTAIQGMFGGDTVSVGGLNFTALAPLGSGAGAIAGPGFCGGGLDCPVNDGNYYVGLNDSSVLLGQSRVISLSALDFSFVAPIETLIDFSVGGLMLRGTDTHGVNVEEFYAFSAQDPQDGQFHFTHITTDAFANRNFWNIEISACLYTVGGDCVNPANNQAQFAIDNVEFKVPEPAGYALTALALGLAAGASRRRQVKK